MAVITQTYDIDLKATGWYPVVEMSQYDTGSRTVVLTVYDGSDLVPLDGCVARVDGRRSDGVEFTASCTIGANSTVSFTVTQEMTKAAGRHVAELVIIDAQGNTVGTQNFVIDVEAAPMTRDSAASADDRTLFDQYTASMESKFASLSDTLATKADALNRTVEDISGLIGTGSKPVEILNSTLDVHTVLSNFTGTAYARATYDPVTALVTCRVGTVDALTRASGTGIYYFELGTLGDEYLPDESLYKYVDTKGRHVYRFANDESGPLGWSCGIQKETTDGHNAGAIGVTLTVIADTSMVIHPDWTVSWYARGGKYLGVTPVGTGGNTVTVGKVTTGDAGTEASVTNSGTARDVVLDFTIPRGAAGGTIPVATADTLGGIKVGSNLTVTADGTLSVQSGIDIIASGTSGAWSWVKFAGGQCMLFESRTLSATTATGYLEYGSDVFPFAINVDKPTAVSVNGGVTGAPHSYVAYTRLSSDRIDAYIYKPDKSNQPIVLYFAFFGWWK